MSVYESKTRKPFLDGSEVEEFTIHAFEQQNGDITAVGEIVLFDSHAEKENDIHIRLPWWAASCKVGNSISPNWLVRREKEKPRFARDSIHDVLCEFIRGELSVLAEKVLSQTNGSFISSSPPPSIPSVSSEVIVETQAPSPVPQEHPVDAPEVVDSHEYVEEEETISLRCVCNQLESSQVHKPFNWRKGKGFFRYKYSYRCLVCACGEQWWQYRPDLELWIRVPDLKAWTFLILCHGSPGWHHIALLPGAAYHVATLERKNVSTESYVLHKAH